MMFVLILICINFAEKKLMLFDLKTPIRQAFWGFFIELLSLRY